MPALHLKITGRVQGVFFRATAAEVAAGLGVRGWVKNQSDGSVLMHAEGEPDDLERFVKWCWQGPAAAVVESVTENKVEPEDCLGFEILRG